MNLFTRKLGEKLELQVQMLKSMLWIRSEPTFNAPGRRSSFPFFPPIKCQKSHCLGGTAKGKRWLRKESEGGKAHFLRVSLTPQFKSIFSKFPNTNNYRLRTKLILIGSFTIKKKVLIFKLVICSHGSNTKVKKVHWKNSYFYVLFNQFLFLY